MKHLLSILVITLTLLLCSTNIIKSQTLTYDQLMDSVNLLEEDKKFEESLTLLNSQKEQHSDQWFNISKELVYLNKKLERFEDNISIFNEGHKKGFFYLIHPQIKEFDVYKDYPEFDEISRTDLELRSKTIEKASIKYELKLPNKFNPKKSYPLIIILHGGGSSLKRVLKHWNSPLLSKKFIRLYLQSFQHYDSNTFGWKVGDKRSDDELLVTFNEIKKYYKVNIDQLYIGGISAGGSYAIDCSIRQVLPIKGFITFCPGIPRILRDDKIRNLSDLNLKGYIIGGENDYYLPRQKQMVAIFDKYDFNYEHQIIDGMGHEYPKNESDLIKKAIKFLSK